MNEERTALSHKEIAAIKARCEQATPGPWKSIVEARGETVGTDFIMTGGEDIYLTGATLADQDFIAHSRQDIPKLIAERLNRRNNAKVCGTCYGCGCRY